MRAAHAARAAGSRCVLEYGTHFGPDDARNHIAIIQRERERHTHINHTGKNAQGWGYAVFGKVTGGAEVLDKIRGVKTGSAKGHQDVPLEPVIIESVTVDE